MEPSWKVTMPLTSKTPHAISACLAMDVDCERRGTHCTGSVRKTLIRSSNGERKSFSWNRPERDQRFPRFHILCGTVDGGMLIPMSAWVLTNECMGVVCEAYGRGYENVVVS